MAVTFRNGWDPLMRDKTDQMKLQLRELFGNINHPDSSDYGQENDYETVIENRMFRRLNEYWNVYEKSQKLLKTEYNKIQSSQKKIILLISFISTFSKFRAEFISNTKFIVPKYTPTYDYQLKFIHKWWNETQTSLSQSDKMFVFMQINKICDIQRYYENSRNCIYGDGYCPSDPDCDHDYDECWHYSLNSISEIVIVNVAANNEIQLINKLNDLILFQKHYLVTAFFQLEKKKLKVLFPTCQTFRTFLNHCSLPSNIIVPNVVVTQCLDTIFEAFRERDAESSVWSAEFGLWLVNQFVHSDDSVRTALIRILIPEDEHEFLFDEKMQILPWIVPILNNVQLLDMSRLNIIVSRLLKYNFVRECINIMNQIAQHLCCEKLIEFITYGDYKD
eukprot:161911_1